MVKGILISRAGKDFEAPSKMDHADLIAEMHTIENLPTQERLHLARMRRAQQLKVARQKEKEWQKLQRSQKHSLTHSKRNSRHISFENSVVLLEAASRNDIQEVANLLQRGITPDAANEDGLTALHQCCIDNNVEMLKLLLDYGANVDAQDSDKWTPLHAAATCGHLNLVKILIGRGANLLAVNTDGNMPYDLCDDEETLDFIEAEMSKRGVTQELIDETRALTEKQMLTDLIQKGNNGGDLEEPDHQGATPLHIASANGYTRVVEFLLEHHVNVDAVDKDLWSPVHAAACWGHMEVLELLAQFGADLYTKNKDDETPSDICEDPEIRERIELLKTEQESKRLAEQQRRRVRRSQSNNTRAQSVRRTSLRDKTLTTKKDAVEETRLRLQAQEVFIAPDSTTEPKSLGTESTISQQSTSPSIATTSTTTGPNSLPSIPNNNFSTNINNSLMNTSSSTSTSTKRKSSSSSSSQNHLASGVEITSTSEVDGGRRNLESLGGTINNNLNGNLGGSLRSNGSNNNANSNSNSNQNINNNSSNNNNNNTSDGSDLIMNGGVGTGGVGGGNKSFQQEPQENIHYHNSSLYNSSNSISRRPPEGKDNEEFALREKVNSVGSNNTVGMGNSTSLTSGTSNSIGNLNKMSSTTSATTDRSTAEIFQATKENGKINVQVTVLVDTHNLDNALNSSGATLANLKKQRSQSRTSALTENGSVISGTSAMGSPSTSHFNSITSVQQQQPTILNGLNSPGSVGGGEFLLTQSINNAICSNASLLSPTESMLAAQNVTKYSGITSDVVSDSTSSKKCCLLM